MKIFKANRAAAAGPQAINFIDVQRWFFD